MNPILRNILAVVAGLFIGSLVNMGLIMVSSQVIPPPNGADLTTEEGLKLAMHLMEPKHFIMPFLAHALGTLFGAFVVAKFSASHHLKFALAIGLLFMLGGLANILILPSPMWFSALDLIVAYLPMAYLGWKLSGKPN